MIPIIWTLTPSSTSALAGRGACPRRGLPEVGGEAVELPVAWGDGAAGRPGESETRGPGNPLLPLEAQEPIVGGEKDGFSILAAEGDVRGGAVGEHAAQQISRG